MPLRDWRHQLKELRWRLSSLRLRERLEGNPAVGASLAAAITLLALLVYMALTPKVRDVRNRTQLWYYDLNTSERYAIDYHDTIEVPPQPAPSGPLAKDMPPLPKGGPAGVRLYRFACGSCSNETFDGYVKTFTPAAAKKWIEEKVPYPTIQDQVLVRRVNDLRWVPEQSPEALKLMSEPIKRCRDQKLRPRECEVND
jgi:hypothetical protein